MSSTGPPGNQLPVNQRPSLLRAISSSSSITKSKLSPSSKRDKPRLYLGLYVRGAPNTSSASNTVFNSSLTCPAYHWAWIVAPKTASRRDPGMCYQILHSSHRSYYEETDLSTQTPSQSATLLCRITLAKVLNEEKLRQILRHLQTSIAEHPTTSSSDTDTDKDNNTPHRHRHRHRQHHNHQHHQHHYHQNSDLDTTENNCLTWIRQTYHILFSANNATNSTPSSKVLKTYMTLDDWAELEETARKYAKKKRNQGRFHYLGIGMNRGPGAGDGNNGLTEWEDQEVATWNFWERRETTA